MRAGIFAKTFAAAGSLDAALDAVVASGLHAIQFNLALTGGPSLPSAGLPPELTRDVREAMRARGLEMVAVSGTFNMAYPDHDVRRHGLEALDRLIAAAPALGTHVVTLCTGSRDTQDMWRRHPDNATDAAWGDMRSCVADALRVGEAHDVVLAVEPEHGNVVADAPAARRLLDELASPHLKVVIDAANLILPGQLADQHATLERAFELLGDELVLAHAKDVLDDGTVVPAGRGGLDYPHYVSLLRQAGFDGPLVLHGLEPDDVAASVSFLERHLRDQLAETR
jgi:sugar phosphate isomerase/epimerase